MTDRNFIYVNNYKFPRIYHDAVLHFKNSVRDSIGVSVQLNQDEIQRLSEKYQFPILLQKGRFKLFAPAVYFKYEVFIPRNGVPSHVDYDLTSVFTKVGTIVTDEWSFYVEAHSLDMIFMFAKAEDALLVKMSM